MRENFDDALISRLDVVIQQYAGSGKTLFVGVSGSAPVYACVAGLASETDLDNFRTLLGYVGGKHQLDGYFSMLPVYDGDSAALLFECCSSGEFYHTSYTLKGGDVSLRQALSKKSPVTKSACWFGGIFNQSTPLPGILRRELDVLAAALRLDV